MKGKKQESNPGVVGLPTTKPRGAGGCRPVCEKLVPEARRMSFDKRGTLLGSWVLVCCSLALAECGRGPQGKVAGAPVSSGRRAASGAKEVEIQEDPVKTGIEAGDASLAGKVRARLAGDPQLRALRIEVDAEAGRVTLWGHVGSAEQRAAAEQQARRTPGVSSVINLIKISGGG
jgi:osmotically-inducible protein OsmY